MRVIIGGSSLAVLLALIIVIHTSVINKSVREDEINRGLENATDYAIDVCSSYYRYIQADDNDDTYITQLMEFFCMTLNSAVKTEEKLTVSCQNWKQRATGSVLWGLCKNILCCKKMKLCPLTPAKISATCTMI